MHRAAEHLPQRRRVLRRGPREAQARRGEAREAPRREPRAERGAQAARQRREQPPPPDGAGADVRRREPRDGLRDERVRGGLPAGAAREEPRARGGRERARLRVGAPGALEAPGLRVRRAAQRRRQRGEEGAEGALRDGWARGQGVEHLVEDGGSGRGERAGRRRAVRGGGAGEQVGGGAEREGGDGGRAVRGPVERLGLEVAPRAAGGGQGEERPAQRRRPGGRRGGQVLQDGLQERPDLLEEVRLRLELDGREGRGEALPRIPAEGVQRQLLGVLEREERAPAEERALAAEAGAGRAVDRGGVERRLGSRGHRQAREPEHFRVRIFVFRGDHGARGGAARCGACEEQRNPRPAGGSDRGGPERRPERRSGPGKGRAGSWAA